MQLLAQKPHHVGTCEGADTCFHQARIECCQSTAGNETQHRWPIHSDTRSSSTPPDSRQTPPGRSERYASRCAAARGAKQTHLLIQQALRLLPVRYLQQAVVEPRIAHCQVVQLARQPLPDRSSRSGWRTGTKSATGTHEAEHRIDPVLVEMQTLPLARLQYQPLLFAVAANLINSGTVQRNSTGRSVHR